MSINRYEEKKWHDYADEIGIPKCDGNHKSLGCERERAKELLAFYLGAIRARMLRQIDTYEECHDIDKNAAGKDCLCPCCLGVTSWNYTIDKMANLLKI